MKAPLALVFAASVLACGSSTPPPTPAVTPAPQASATPPSPPPAPEKKQETDHFVAAEAAPHDDPNESSGPIQLETLVAKGAPKSTFPKATIGDHECLSGGLAYSGKHKVDYDALVEKCGTTTGMVMYTKPVEGRLHATKDKRDHFQFKVFKGMCYRYFAVADDGIKDLDIVVLKNTSLLATDKTEHPIAIIDSDKPWCVDEDMNLDFGVEVDGHGAGKYMFGIWTRPKS